MQFWDAARMFYSQAEDACDFAVQHLLLSSCLVPMQNIDKIYKISEKTNNLSKDSQLITMNSIL